MNKKIYGSLFASILALAISGSALAGEKQAAKINTYHPNGDFLVEMQLPPAMQIPAPGTKPGKLRARTMGFGLGKKSAGAFGESNRIGFAASEGKIKKFYVKGHRDSDNPVLISGGQYEVVMVHPDAIQNKVDPSMPKLYGIFLKSHFNRKEEIGVARWVEFRAAVDASTAEKEVLAAEQASSGAKAEVIKSILIDSIDGWAVTLSRETAGEQSSPSAKSDGHSRAFFDLGFACLSQPKTTENGSDLKLFYYCLGGHQDDSGEGYAVVFAAGDQYKNATMRNCVGKRLHRRFHVISKKPVPSPAGYKIVLSKTEPNKTEANARQLHAVLLGIKTDGGIHHWLEYVAAKDAAEAKTKGEKLAENSETEGTFVEMTYPVTNVNGCNVTLIAE